MKNPLELDMPEGLIDPQDLLPRELRRPGFDERLHETLARRRLSHILIGLRNRAGYTQRELAEALDISPSRVSRIEAATTPWPKAQTIERYARLCGVALGYAFFQWQDHTEGSIFPLDPADYPKDAEAAEDTQLANLLPAELRREGFDEAWRQSLPRRRLAQHLVQLRSAAGLTQKELAAQIDLDPAEVSRMESATHSWPKAERLQRYAHVLGWEVGLAFLEPDGAQLKGWIIPLAEPEPGRAPAKTSETPAELPLKIGGTEEAAPRPALSAAARMAGPILAAGAVGFLLRTLFLTGRNAPYVQAFLPEPLKAHQDRDDHPAAEL